MFTQIGEIAEPIPVVQSDTKCDIVYHLFKSNPSLEGIAGGEGCVINDAAPILSADWHPVWL